MIGQTIALAAALLFSTQLYAQTNQGAANPAQGTTSGPASGSPTSMGSPQSGPLETQHQRDVVRDQSQSVRDKGAETGAASSQTGEPKK